jgi:hypothetical protein
VDPRPRSGAGGSAVLSGSRYSDAPPDVVAALRNACGDLPEAYEDKAWAGTRWRIRNRTFAHVLCVDSPTGPTTVVTFRSSGAELDALQAAGHPFFAPRSGSNWVGMVIDSHVVDWEEARELLTESYCTLAPKKLVALVDRPNNDDG